MNYSIKNIKYIFAHKNTKKLKNFVHKKSYFEINNKKRKKCSKADSYIHN